MVVLLTLNKALLGGLPRIARYVLMLISLCTKLNHALYILLLACMLWFECALQNTFIGLLN